MGLRDANKILKRIRVNGFYLENGVYKVDVEKLTESVAEMKMLSMLHFNQTMTPTLKWLWNFLSI